MARERILLLLLPFLFLLASVLIHGTSAASLQYGDRCSSEENSTIDLMCNAKESLTCQNGTCLCSDMTSMTYDPAIGLCLGLAGRECVYHPTEAHLPNFRKTHCVPYASCENGTCSCWSAFYMDESAHCSRKRGYLQQCQMSYQCDTRQGFVCKEGLCVCDSMTSAYDPEVERCVGKANEPCINQYRECVENYKCKLGVCSCKYKEVAGPDGKLKCDNVAHKYGKACGRHRGTCGAFLLCINGRCRCTNPDYMTYDYEQRSCVSLIGGPCTVVAAQSSPTIVVEQEGANYEFDRSRKNKNKNKGANSATKNKKILKNYLKNKKKQANTQIRDNSTLGPDTDDELTEGQKIQTCIPYARCLPYGEAPQTSEGPPEMGRCECERGYIETKKGKCNLPYNAQCDTHSKNKKDICDETVPLYCVNNVCSCKNALDVYDDETKGCKKSVGSLCWKDPSCVGNSRCIRYSPRLPGRCMCPPNTHPDPNSTSCLLSYDVDPSIGYEEEDDVE